MSYSHSSFDIKGLNFNDWQSGTKWITIEDEDSPLFQSLISYIPAHIVENTDSSDSYAVEVLPATSKEKEANAIGSTIHGRISLKAGTHIAVCF